MKVHFVQSGGFVGAVRGCVLDTAALDREEAQELERLVRESGLAACETQFSTEARDLQQYEITIEDERPVSVAFDDRSMPRSARLLVGFLKQRARLPRRLRVWCKPGYEFLVFMPIAVLAFALAFWIGPQLEALAFGGDFRGWWRSNAWWSGSLFDSAFGFPYEQRNAMLVGFMMAFAIIPIIFSISEDAFSNVPQSLVSASLALGASRWQTAIRVVLPTASAGVFS